MSSKKTIIEGITEDGQRFRPSNWAEMMAGTLQDGRLKYSPLLKPMINAAGNSCVSIDHSLKDTDPQLYNHILQFAAMNRLRICHPDDELDEYTDDDDL
jgi:hypothetical protein